MPVQQADLDLLKKHLPSLGVQVAGANPTPEEVLAGLKNYIAMYNEDEAEGSKIRFDPKVGLTDGDAQRLLKGRNNAKFVLDMDEYGRNKIKNGGDIAGHTILGLKDRKDAPQVMKDNPDKFFALVEEGDKVIKAIVNLQKEKYFFKPVLVKSKEEPASVTPQPVASPQVTTGPKPGAPQTTTGGNPSTGLHFRDVYRKDRPPRTEGSPAPAAPAPAQQTNPPPSSAGASAPPPSPAPQSTVTSGDGQGTGQGGGEPKGGDVSTLEQNTIKKLEESLGKIAASGKIPDMPVPGPADGTFDEESKASLQFALAGMKLALRVEGKYKGPLDGTYSESIGEQLQAGFKNLPPESKKKMAEDMGIKPEDGKNLDDEIAGIIGGLNVLRKRGKFDNAKATDEKTFAKFKTAGSILNVMDYLPDSFKGQIFGFLQSSQIGQMLMKILEAFTGIPLAKMLGVKTQEQGTKSDTNSNVKSHIPQEMVQAYNDSLAKYGNDPAKFLVGSYDDLLKKNGNDPAKLKEAMMATVRELNEKYNKSDLLFNSKQLETIVENALEAGKTGGGTAFSASIMSEVKGKPKPSSSGPAVAPQTAPQTPPPASDAPQGQPAPTSTGEGTASGVSYSAGSDTRHAGGGRLAYRTSTSFNIASGAAGEARAFTASYAAGGLDAGALNQYAGNPITSLGASNNPSIISTTPERQPPVPQVATVPSGNAGSADRVSVVLEGSGNVVKLPIIEPKEGEKHFFESKRRLDTSTRENLDKIESMIGIRPTIFDPRHPDGKPGLTIDKDLSVRKVQAVIYGLDGKAQETIDNFARANPGAGLNVGDMIVARDKRLPDGKLQTQYIIVNGDDLRRDLKSFNPQSGAEGLRNLIEKLHIDDDLHVAVSEIMVAGVEIPDGSTKGEIKLTPLRDKAGISIGGNIQEYIQVAQKEQQEQQTARDGISMKDEKGRNIGVAERYMTPEFNARADGNTCIRIKSDQQLAFRDNGFVVEDRNKTGFGSYLNQLGDTVDKFKSLFGGNERPKVDPQKICGPGM